MGIFDRKPDPEPEPVPEPKRGSLPGPVRHVECAGKDGCYVATRAIELPGQGRFVAVQVRNAAGQIVSVAIDSASARTIGVGLVEAADEADGETVSMFDGFWNGAKELGN